MTMHSRRHGRVNHQPGCPSLHPSAQLSPAQARITTTKNYLAGWVHLADLLLDAGKPLVAPAGHSPPHLTLQKIVHSTCWFAGQEPAKE